MSTLEEKRASFFQEVQKVHESRTLESLKSDVATSDFVREQMEIFEACKRRQVPAPDVLDVERSACSVCPALCEAYEPFEVFLLETQERVYESQFVPTLCRNCKCPAYYHRPISRPLRFVPALLQGVKRFQLKQEHLNFPGIVAIFSIDYAYLEAHREQTSYKAEEDKLFQLVQHAGFQIISRSVRAISEQESVVLNGPRETKPINAFRSFIKTRVQARTTLLTGSVRQSAELSEEMYRQSLLLCLSSTAYKDPQIHFGKFMEGATTLMPRVFTVVYRSRTTLQAFGDMETFFPHIFEVRYCVSLVAPEPKAMEISSEGQDSISEFFRSQHSVLKGQELVSDKDPNLMNVGKVFDTLLFNGFNPWRQSQLDPTEEGIFLKHLDKILQERKAVNFLRFLLTSKTDDRLTAIAASRVGISLLLTNNPFSMDTYYFTHPKAVFYLNKFFFPELASMERTVVVFRPITVRSGLHTLFMDVFRINRFLVLKSKFKMLTRDEALSFMPDIDPGAISGYLDCMLEGECQIVVFAKFGAVHEAQTLCEGSRHGRKRTEKSLLGSKALPVRKEKEIQNPYNVKLESDLGVEGSMASNYYEEEVLLYPSKGVNSLFTLSPFTSLSELLDLEMLVDSWMDELELERGQPNLYVRDKTRQELRLFSRQFNFAVHCSQSKEAAERETLAFFPSVREVSEALLVCKDAAIGLSSEIALLFQHMKLTVVRRGSVDLESAQGDCYHVVKEGCREELRAALSFNDSPFSPLMPQHLGQLFELVDTEPQLQRGIAQLCSHVASFTGELIAKLSDVPRRDILSYITLATLREEIKQPAAGVRELPYRSLISTLDENHVHYVVTLKSEKEVEVAIRRLASQEGSSQIENRLSIFNEYEGMKWYFREVRKFYPKLVPAFFHYRIEPSHPDMQVERVFMCEEFVGDFFMDVAARDMLKDRDREKATRKLVSDPNRGSIATFMWGRNLAILCQRLETVQTLSIEDCGPIMWNGKEMLGLMDDLHFYELEKQKYLDCLASLKRGWANYIPVEKAIHLEKMLRRVLESSAFRRSRELSSVALVPEFLSYNDIRVRQTVQEDIPPEEIKSSKFMRVDLDRQARLELSGVSLARTVHALTITNTQPAKYSKRHLAANVYWILSVYLRKIERKVEVVGGSADEYEALIESLCDGFAKTYGAEEHVDMISLFKMEFFLFSLWRCWNTVLTLEVLDQERTELLAKRDESLRSIRGAYKEVVESFATDLDRVRIESEKLDFELTHQLEQLCKVDIEAQLSAEERAKYMAIHHERYFKHYGMDMFETNLANPSYPDVLMEKKFVALPSALTQTINPRQSRMEQMWTNPPPRGDTNLHQIPDSAYKFLATNVKATRWVTEEKQKKLVASFVQNLMTQSINRPAPSSKK